MAKYIKAEDAAPYLTKYIPGVEAVERSEYEKLKQKNIELEIEYDDVMKRNALRVTEYKQLRAKIDNALKEMDDLASHKVRPISFDQAVAVDMCINILKRNIGDES